MRSLNSNPNVDNSDLANYPDGRIKDNTGTGNGTGVNERVYGDIHQTIAKLMRSYNILPNGLPDNEQNGFQIIEAMIALASKNDYVYPITSVSSVLEVPIKIGLMKIDESIICKSSVNLTTETQIKGSDGLSLAFTNIGTFKTNEYVRFIKTASGIVLIRLADSASLDAMVNDFNYLKKASQAEEDAGTIDTKATTPKVNKVTFEKRVNGIDSVAYLAKPTGDPDAKNGLLSKEDKAILDAIGASPVKNIGWFSGLNVANTTGNLPVSGNITLATATSSVENTFITCTMQNAMANTNYYVRTFIESQGTNINTDNDIANMVFKPISTTQFTVAIREIAQQPENLKVHIEVVQI
jgi:hypothetical protein